MQLAWEKTDTSVSLLNRGAAVWTFRYGPAAPKPYFHPVALPGGPVLTWDRPADHTWHHGLWFSWKFLNGVNYWEEDPNGVSAGHTSVRDVQTRTADDHSARIELKLEYGPPSQAAVLTEQRTIAISAPDATGSYYMDWTMEFTAGAADVRLDRTPLPQEPGRPSLGGYAGISLRWADAVRDLEALQSQWAVGRVARRAAARESDGH